MYDYDVSSGDDYLGEAVLPLPLPGEVIMIPIMMIILMIVMLMMMITTSFRMILKMLMMALHRRLKRCAWPSKAESAVFFRERNWMVQVDWELLLSG